MIIETGSAVTLIFKSYRASYLFSFQSNKLLIQYSATALRSKSKQ